MGAEGRRHFYLVLLIVLGTGLEARDRDNARPRAREVGISPGVLTPGPLNAITDVKGVKVGHVTLIEGQSTRTGVTAILPHSGNLFSEKVPAAIYLGNAFGKLMGYTQVEELGNIETPILLTNTLNVGIVADGVIEYMLSLPGNENVMSINPIVGETNDGWLNDIRSRPVRQHHVREAIEKATTGAVEEGSVGAGTGTICFGFKGGIGTSSRQLLESQGGYVVGVLVQSNFGGILTINGAPVGRELAIDKERGAGDGSCMIVVATDAPLLSRNLKRLAKRAVLGLARTGSVMSNSSGDYVIAFSTAKGLRQGPESATVPKEILPNSKMNLLFTAVVEATEEAVYNSLFKATAIKGRDSHFCEALPIDRTLQICRKYKVLEEAAIPNLP
jgi:D-aminopeptidase